MISRVVAIVVSAVTVANAPVVINNHLLLVKILTIARTIVARTIDATTRKATLGITLDSPVLHLSLTPTELHREKTQ